MKISKERIDYINKLTEKIPPITLTITDPHEQAWVVSAFIGHIAGTDKELGLALSAMLGASCKLLGIEGGVDSWISAVNAARDNPMPKFIKPLLVHHFTHIEAEHNKKHGQQ